MSLAVLSVHSLFLSFLSRSSLSGPMNPVATRMNVAMETVHV
ncbi:hypothetical protein SAMN05216176_102653 [Nitratireductor indicus]|nr:hypothetical protein SAMN05216176_102653 [Nitratireductor indicus]